MFCNFNHQPLKIRYNLLLTAWASTSKEVEESSRSEQMLYNFYLNLNKINTISCQQLIAAAATTTTRLSSIN